MKSETDVVDRLIELNNRYIRKPECKETLDLAVKEIRKLRKIAKQT